MAHDCPECGTLCRCGGDIDDIHWGDDTPFSDKCTHWKQCELIEEDEEEYSHAAD